MPWHPELCCHCDPVSACTLLLNTDFYLLKITQFNSPSLVAHRLKRLSGMWETRVQSLGQEDPWRRKWNPTPLFLPGESHGGRSLVGYSPWGHKESDTTERLHFTFSSVQFSPQLCPTLCNPMDYSTPGFPVHHQLPEIIQTQDH